MIAHPFACSRTPLVRQQGVTLIVTLVFMIVLTLFVTAGARSTMMQERMSGYSWEQGMAFQSAEFALRQGEIAVARSNRVPSDLPTDCSDAGFCANGYLPDWSSDTTWASGGNFVTTSKPDSRLAEGPKYYIEYVGGGAAKATAGNKWDYYRVMARGVGRVTTTQSVLISTYRP